jgi:peptidoglycan/LPS O-acetylase OafA/YrhL
MLFGYLAQAGFIMVWIINSRAFDGAIFLTSIQFGLVLCLLFGQLLYFLHAELISRTSFVALSALNWVLYIYSSRIIDPNSVVAGASNTVSFAYCYAIFVVAYVLRANIRLNAAWRFLENTSYSLYLFHGPVGVLVIGSLALFMPFEAAFALGVTASLSVAWLVYQIVERPAMKLARTLTEPKPKQAAPVSVEQGAG